MVPTPVNGFGLSFGPLLLLMAVLIGVEIWLFVERKREWSPILWVPLICISGKVALELFGGILFSGAVGEQAGWARLGGIIVLLFNWPWIVIFLGALFAFPRRWTPLWATCGCALGLMSLFLSHRLNTDEVTIQVVGKNGEPVPKFTLECEGSRVGDHLNLGSFTTDANGCFSFRYHPADTPRFKSAATNDAQAAMMEIAMPRNSSNAATQQNPDEIALTYWWQTSDEVPQGFSQIWKKVQQKPIPFFLKPRHRLIYTPLQEHVRAVLEEARTKGYDGYVLQNACRNAESLDLMDEIAAISSAHPELRKETARGLTYTAEVLYHINAAFKNLPRVDYRASSSKTKPTSNLEMLCNWAGVDPSVPFTQRNLTIEKKIRSYADRLIDLSRPDWTNDSDAVLVLHSLGNDLAHSAVARLPTAFRDGNERARQEILFVLSYLHPTLEDVQFLISSDDAKLVVSGYDLAMEKIPDDQVQSVLDRLRALKPRDTREQGSLNHVIAVLEGRTKK